MKRHKQSLSHYNLLSMDMGKLYPVSCVEVMFGDVWRGSSSALIRVSPLIAPVMHPVHVQLHHWFVPARLLWDGWEDFITGGEDGEGGDSGVYPTITAPVSSPQVGFAAKSLPDYLGIPPSVASVEVSALPIRAYNLIFNENYRDQDLVSPLAVPTTSGNDTTSPLVIQTTAWEKDYFSDARPFAQKGPDVTLPLGTSAPVTNDGSLFFMAENAAGTANPQQINRIGANPNVLNMAFGGGGSAGPLGMYFKSGLEADLSSATAATVSALREAMALQRYEEARAQWGSRYVEYLRYYGVRSSDARLQRPEYLGGAKQTLTFSEVLQTGVTDGSDPTPAGVGDMYGHGIGALKSKPYLRFFEEHGYVLTLMTVRPVAMYQNGLHRMWSRRIKEDYFTQELALIGQQEVFSREVFAASDADGGDEVFGYQNRYREYCEHPSGVAGEMRDTLDFWHMARQFSSAPTLNGSFINCIPEKRNFQVQTNDVLWVFVNNMIRARRFVQRNPTSRIL